MDNSYSFRHQLIWDDSLADELQHFLTRHLKCPETAAGLTHETYLRLQQCNPNEQLDNARALAFQIALNLAKDYRRQMAIRNRHLLDQAPETAESNSPKSRKTSISEQRRLELQQALDELPADCQTVFKLHSIDGLSYSDIAERQGISVALVSQHLARAMSHCLKKSAINRQK